MASTYGKTWWGQQWLNALTKIDYDNRLPRGRAYANKGAVKKIEIEGNMIRAAVQGSSPKPYRVEVRVPPINREAGRNLALNLAKDAFLLSKILSRELPPEVLDIARKHGASIFPGRWNDLGMECSCPDWAVPCKHLAAVIYLIANEIDRNPFLVFSLRGLDLMAELAGSGVSAESTETIVSPWDITTDEVQGQPPPAGASADPLWFEKLDLSTLGPRREELLSLLMPDPPFYAKDFKQVLQKRMTAAAKETVQWLKEPDRAEAFRQTPEKDPAASKRKKKPGKASTSQDERTLNPLPAATGFRLSFNGDGQPAAFLTQGEETEAEIEEHLLFGFLRDLEDKELPRLASGLLVLHTVFRLCMALLQNGAFIPQLMRGSGPDSFFIRWLPATLDETVNNLLKSIEPYLPLQLVCFELRAPESRGNAKPVLRYQAKAESLLSLCSLFIGHFVERAAMDIADPFFPEPTRRGRRPAVRPAFQGEANVDTLFFRRQPVSFDSFTQREIPNAIQLWLNKFYFTRRDWVPVLYVEDLHDGRIMIHVSVERRGDKPGFQPLGDFLLDTDYREAHTAVLKDLGSLADYFPDLKKLIQNKGKSALTYGLAQFTDVLLKAIPILRLTGIRVLLPRSMRHLLKPSLSLSASAKAVGKVESFLDLERLLQFSWRVAVGDELLDPKEFLEAVQGLSGLVRIRDQYVLIDEKDMQTLLKNLTKEPRPDPAERLQILLAESYEQARVELSPQLRHLLDDMLKADAPPLPSGLMATLRPYQVNGYAWLWKNSRLGLGALIADDMGLGKTLQVISALLKLKEEGRFQEQKALAVVPTSLLTNWMREVEKFAPALRAVIFHGANRKFDFGDADLVLTTYGLLRLQLEDFKKIHWCALVLDEAQALKNPGSEQSKAVKSLRGDIRIAMTGTPVENRLGEYWSIFDFLNKGFLGSQKYFAEEFATPIHIYRDQRRIEVFRKITRPFMLRRLKTDKSIINDLPDKIEQDQFATMTTEQAALYQSVVEESLKAIEGSEVDTIQRQGLVLKLMTALKQVCNHPCHYLKTGAETPERSGKVTLLLDLLGQIRESGEKVLLFTQYTQMGELLVRILEHALGRAPLFLHGGLSRKQRDTLVATFQAHPLDDIFILSLKAGGTGLNLTAANHVIHFDRWWNPAVEAQATDRAFRIGQQRNVQVHRFITQGTLEEKINAMLRQKKELADLTVQAGENWIGKLNDRELKELVRLR